jgi:uncharacterized protein (DUF362 family)
LVILNIKRLRMKPISRREFIGKSVKGLAAISLVSTAPAIFTSKNSVYAREKSKVLISKAAAAPGREELRTMLNKSLSILLNEKEPALIWKKLFKPEETVGIKVNAISGRRLSTSPLLAAVVAEELKKAGLKEENIIIWDRTERELDNAGYKINTDRSGVKCMGTDSLQDGGYTSAISYSGEIGSIFSSIMENCDALINIPILKDHDIAGLSLGMKNWFGAIHNPNKYHDHNCSPYIADLSSHPLIKGKQRLIIADALRVQPNGGPAYKPQWMVEYNSLLISTDPVALDRTGLDIIENLRTAKRLKSLRDDGRYPHYLQVAEEQGLGNFDESKIDRVEVSI